MIFRTVTARPLNRFWYVGVRDMRRSLNRCVYRFTDNGIGIAHGGYAATILDAALWNAVYNTAFDWVEGRLTGRTADLRPYLWRVVHACGFEGGLVLMSLPIVMWWTGMSWLEALLADIALALAYVAYAFVFNLAYDRVFPIKA